MYETAEGQAYDPNELLDPSLNVDKTKLFKSRPIINIGPYSDVPQIEEYLNRAMVEINPNLYQPNAIPVPGMYTPSKSVIVCACLTVRPLHACSFIKGNHAFFCSAPCHFH